MSQTISFAPVRKSIQVKATQAHAFDVFTAGMSRWWNPSHSINKSRSPLKEVVIEPHTGGRWYERGEDGSECDWGKVLTWEPPARLVLAWQVNGDWTFDPDFVTEVEIRFLSDGSGMTRVELEHRDIDRFGDKAEAIHTALDSPEGWGGLLERFADAVDR
jgi:uncharacterized protein YndB with AHSA1/START domain